MKEVSTVKQKISPVIAILIILLVLGFVSAVMYYRSEPPVVGSKRTFEEERQRMEATKQGIMGMKRAVKGNDAKKTSAGTKGDTKSETRAEIKSHTPAKGD
jgi:hypothetical protein